jgi:hypothetical protein
VTVAAKMSDIRKASRTTGLLLSTADQGSVFEGLESRATDSYGAEKVCQAVRSVPTEQLRCSFAKKPKDDFVDEGYFSPSPTESENEFFGGSVRSSHEPEIDRAPHTPQIAINDSLLQLPEICITDENGETETVASDDDEHGQLWNFARDKIARRMFFIRADRRTEHMESTFYSDLYPV